MTNRKKLESVFVVPFYLGLIYLATALAVIIQTSYVLVWFITTPILGGLAFSFFNHGVNNYTLKVSLEAEILKISYKALRLRQPFLFEKNLEIPVEHIVEFSYWPGKIGYFLRIVFCSQRENELTMELGGWEGKRLARFYPDFKIRLATFVSGFSYKKLLDDIAGILTEKNPAIELYNGED